MAGSLNKMAVFMVIMAIGALVQIQSSEAQTIHRVGDRLGWVVPPGGPIAYSTWASTQTFTVGDVLVFNFTTNMHDVAEVTQAAFDGCNITGPISLSTTGPTNITLGSAGTHYFICTFGSHCFLGQKLAINVSAASSTPPAPAPQPPATTPSPVSTPTPAASPAPTPARAPVTHIVGEGLGWNILPGGASAYRTWASNKSFVVGDILEFNFINRTHDVAELTRTAFESCNTTTTLSLTTTSPARITLTTAGEHFFTCTFPQHCATGQQLAINVTGTGTATPPSASPPTSATAPTPSSSTTAPTPSTTATPTTPSSDAPTGSVTAPPPPSGSAPPSFAVAALPITFISMALAFFY